MAPSPWPGSRSAGPQSSASRSPSFYYANSKLYDATREAFDAAVPVLDREGDFLDAFKRLGCLREPIMEGGVRTGRQACVTHARRTTPPDIVGDALHQARAVMSA
jgi:hypothetical protein